MNPYLVSIRSILREEVMGLLALCALASALIPIFFPWGAQRVSKEVSVFDPVLANIFCLYYFAIKGWLR